MYKTRQYKIWQWIKERCKNINNNRCRNYWFRWITYDKKWKTFEWFWEDMKKWYADNLTIDRIDNNWNYTKNNCKWATRIEQWRNKRNTLMIWDISLKQYCEENNLIYKTLANHYKTNKWKHLKIKRRNAETNLF